MRKLATIQTIAEIKPIKDADFIVAYRVNGWWVVGRKDEYKVGDKIVYVEIDAVIPESVAPFLKQNGEGCHILKTMKFKKQISQGLLLPLHRGGEVGEDVTDELGITLYEPPTPQDLQAAGVFPAWGRKTDQQRIQNNYEELLPVLQTKKFVLEEKLDGTSCSVGYYKTLNEVVICSRNLSLKLDCDNIYTKAISKTNILEALKRLKKSVMISGEICGPGVQGNPYKLTELTWFVFDVYMVDEQRYLTVNERKEFLLKLDLPLKQVPQVAKDWSFSNTSCEDILKLADGNSWLNANQRREGVVAKCITDGDVSFKVISNLYLLKQDISKMNAVGNKTTAAKLEKFADALEERAGYEKIRKIR